MLVLSRKSNKQIIICNSIRITVLETRDTEVVLAIEAPNENNIYRAEKPRIAAAGRMIMKSREARIR